MTMAELIEAMRAMPDDAEVVYLGEMTYESVVFVRFHAVYVDEISSEPRLVITIE